MPKKRHKFVLSTIILCFITLTPITLESETLLSIEDDLDEQVESEIEEQVESEIEEQVESEIEEQVESEIEEQVESEIEEQVESEIEEQVESEIEEQVESEIEEQVESEIEEQVESEIEEQVESEIEEQVESEIEEEVESEIEDDVESEIEKEIESEIEERVEAKFDSEFEEEDIDSDEYEIEFTKSEEDDDDDDDELDTSDENEIDDYDSEDSTDSDREEDNNDDDRDLDANIQLIQLVQRHANDETSEIVEAEDGSFHVLNEWIALGNAEDIATLRKIDVEIQQTYYLKELETHLIYINDSNNQLLKTLRLKFPEFLKKIDKNNFYLESEKAPLKNGPPQKNSKPDLDNTSLPNARVGIVDSTVLKDHPWFAHVNGEFLDIVNESSAPKAHGTSIFSLFASQEPGFLGFLPNARYFCAGVFFKTSRGFRGTTAKNMVIAIDWLVEKKVDVINMSLEGPPNKLLHQMIKKAEENRIFVVAAAGNGGPTAPPAFPAAYQEVIAVTAVNTHNEPYVFANHGDYIDFSALGVDVLHASITGTNIQKSSGTSFATPEVSATLVKLIHQYGKEHALSILKQQAKDLGKKDRDTVFGYGLIEF